VTGAKAWQEISRNDLVDGSNPWFRIESRIFECRTTVPIFRLANLCLML
jgi:hypothetical protein